MGLSPLSLLDLIARVGLSDLRPEQFPHDAAKRLRSNQLRGTMEQMRVMLPCNTFFAPALSYQAWNAGINGIVVLWTGVMVAFSWWLFLSWRTTYETDGSANDMRRFVRQTYVNSGLWTIGMMIVYPVVSGDQKAIVTAIMAGTLAIGTLGFSRTPAAALAYLIIQTIGMTGIALLTGIANGSNTDFIIAFLSFTAGLSVFNATLERGKAMIAAFRNHEMVSEKSELIDLLLKDYEEQATQWLWQTNAEGKIVSAPVQVLHILGVPPDNQAETLLFDAIANTVSPDVGDDLSKLHKAIAAKVDFHDITLSFKDPETGDQRWIVIKGRPQFAGSQFNGFRGIFADATAAVEAKRQVQYLATHDSLTGLRNRNAVQKQLDALNLSDAHAAAILIDLDGFKQVNDSYGHHIGDQLLKVVADRLRQSGPDDACIARLGGDEFFLLCTSDAPIDPKALAAVADELVEQLNKTYEVDGYRLQLSASIGIAQFPANTSVGIELLLMADLALYEAKNNGRNRSEFFDVGMQDAMNSRLEVTERLRLAVRTGKIHPYYQSQHALSDGRLIGFEALARWCDDKIGVVGPDIFIPIAEQTGLIVELGELILRQACQDAVQWIPHLPATGSIVSVNFSPIQFARTDVTAMVRTVLADTGLPPERLEVEVTEGVMILDKEKIANSLSELSELGISIALDDFGTGYSSLSYLKALPLNRLKVDRSFVTDLGESTVNPIVHTVIQLGKSLGLNVIAEGVENAEQERTLSALGCHDGQGFYYGRPMPFDSAHAMVTAQSATKRASTG